MIINKENDNHHGSYMNNANDYHHRSHVNNVNDYHHRSHVNNGNSDRSRMSSQKMKPKNLTNREIYSNSKTNESKSNE